ncbi:hypothetical protein BSIN_5188 [Burkholderia singularis]|uniref:Uncharacterized protein n=1 Tax=Burkholderia singularis TaxID=1503053 RepID=A0A238HBW6_9BURK|nr:hypothetical protein BSIN_5188 [Burkholderia singularis]
MPHACFFVALSAVPRWPSMQVRAAHWRHSSTYASAGKIERRSFAATSACVSNLQLSMARAIRGLPAWRRVGVCASRR